LRGGRGGRYVFFFLGLFFECSDSWTDFAVLGGNDDIPLLHSQERMADLPFPFSFPFIFFYFHLL
jgi:hypothetical protein